MKTRLISFGLILMLSVPLAIAQNTGNAKMAFAILGGVNFQNLNGKDINGDKLENDMTIGFHAGVNVQIPLVPHVLFSTRITFFNKRSQIY